MEPADAARSGGRASRSDRATTGFGMDSEQPACNRGEGSNYGGETKCPPASVAERLFGKDLAEDVAEEGLAIHKWLGSSLTVLLVGLALWRWWIFKRDRCPSMFYLLVALAAVAALIYQGHLGGAQSFAM